MYRTLIASLLLLAAQTSSAGVTVGLDLITDSGDREWDLSRSSTSSVLASKTQPADSSGFRIRLAMGSIEEKRPEFYFSLYNVDDKGQFSDQNEWEIGANYIRPLMQKPLIPFVKIGAGSTRDSLFNAHLNFGAGLSFAFTDNLAATANLEYIFRAWEDLESASGATTLSIMDSVFRLGVGIDFSF